MRKTSEAVPKRTAPAAIPVNTPAATEALEVNVLFTDAPSTMAALKCAASFARDLGARICLRAGVVVPWQLPLDHPPISVNFTEKLLRRLAEHLDQGVFHPTVQLYVCRNWIETLAQVLKPQSLVILGGRKHGWWPTRASRMADALRRRGFRVVMVDAKPRAAEGL